MNSTTVMQVPLRIDFRGLDRTPDLESFIERKVSKLEKFCDYMTRCRVAIERPHRHETSGNPYRVGIDITVPPGHEIVVNKDPRDHDLHDDLPTVINNAFEAAERQLKELVERQRREVKTHEEPRALVVRLFRDEGYGFIKTLEEDREIYFHKNAVSEEDDFEDLAIGTEVRFAEAMGEMGPQATTVKIVGKRGERISEGEMSEAPETGGGST